MHPSPQFRWTDQGAMLDLVAATSFTRLFAATPQGPRVAHAPVLVADGPTLRFHLANANPLAQLDKDVPVLALTEGPHAYLSANWYRDVRGAVPTWNYLSVECEGRLRRLDRTDLIDLLDALADRLEPQVGENWTRAKMDPARFDAMLGAISGFELRIDDLRGTKKVSQNKSDDEAAAVLTGMDASAPAMAAAIRAARP